MHYKDLDGRKVAREITAAAADEVASLTKAGWHPKLVSLTIGDADPIQLYVRNQRRAAETISIAFEERHFPPAITRAEVLATIGTLNADPRTTGIIIQRPVPEPLSIKELQSAIHPLKDVEGMHPASIGNIIYDEVELAPCTAMASVELLKRTGLRLAGLEAVVIGHSVIVGKPIAFLLLAEGATITVCHDMTRDLAMHTRHADAVFVAVGKPKLMTGEMIKPGAAVIDIGINRVEGPDGGMMTVGDADYESCREVAGWITPVPGGVGPVTVAFLMRNTLVAARRQKAHYEAEFSKTGWAAGFVPGGS